MNLESYFIEYVINVYSSCKFRIILQSTIFLQNKREHNFSSFFTDNHTCFT